MTKLGDFFESAGQEVDPLISEISVMKQLIKERIKPLDLLRELLSNAGAKEVGATEIRINYYVNQHGHVFEVADDGCGMDYTGQKTAPGRLDRFLALGLSATIGQKSDEFSWKGLGSKLAYQSQRVEIETYRANAPEVVKAEINDLSPRRGSTSSRQILDRTQVRRSRLSDTHRIERTPLSLWNRSKHSSGTGRSSASRESATRDLESS